MLQIPDSAFAYLMQDVTRQMRTLFDRRATRFAMTRAQWRALKAIRHHEGLSQSELAEHLELQPIPVSRVVDRLEKAGYIERRADPGDRRRWRLHPTAKAHAVFAEMEAIAADLRHQALDGLAPADYDTLLRLLAHIKANLATLQAADETRSLA